MKVTSLALCLVLCAVSVHCQLSIRWNGTDLDGEPTFIFHDELFVSIGDTSPIDNPDGPGRLICRSEASTTVNWFLVNGGGVTTGTAGNFIQRRISGATPSLSRVALNSLVPINTPRDDDATNGLWSCSASGMPTLYVGIYGRAEGEGDITSNTVSLQTSSPFTGNPPTFTLRGMTRGGPPTTYTWTRNGAVITANSSYTISIAVTSATIEQNRIDAAYASTLDVSGHLPGLYEYTVSNRAITSTPTRTDSMGIEGEPPTELMAMQTGPTLVLVSWRPPSIPPSNGYRITTNSSNTGADAPSSSDSQTISISTPGVHTIQVMSRSVHLPGGMVELQGVTVRGTLSPSITTSLLTAISVTVSWTQPPFSFPPVGYTVELTRVIGSNQQLCDTFVDNRPEASTSATSLDFSNLQEFSSYSVRVTARFMEFGLSLTAQRSLVFMTSSAAPSSAPTGVLPSPDRRSISVTWDDIECIDQNGMITGYEVEFQRVGGTAAIENVNSQVFTADELQPFTDYTFRVAGVNNAGTGPFTTAIPIRTNEDVPDAVSNFVANFNLITVVFDWDPPQNPNGIIISYELTYRVNSSSIMTRNVSTTNFTMDLDLNTVVSSISVRAYTNAGPGPNVTAENVVIPDVPTLPLVMNVRVMQVADSDTSVIVSWDSVTVTGITGYTVYYSQVSGRKRQSGGSVNVPSTENSVTITSLVGGAQYVFQVTVRAEFLGRPLEGSRSEPNAMSMIILQTPTGAPIGVIIGVIVLVIAVIAAVVIVILVVVLLRRRSTTGMHKPSSVHYTRPDQMINMNQPIEPTIDEFPEDTTAIEGESVVFKVGVSGKPFPTLTWYHDDVEITNNYSQEILDDGSLNLPSAEMKQSGVYKLVAQNPSGSVQQQVKLSVQMDGEKTPDTDRRVMTFTPVPVSEFGEYVARNHSNNNQGFRDQFNALESGDSYAKTIGLSEEFKKLNRFANITNYDHNRIVLTPLQGHADCDREFINGCYIDGYSIPKKFIATQGPTPKTMIDFWRLIWQEKPPTIVMVTNLKESNKKKCEQYWPESGSETFGPFKVTLTEHQVFADYCIRTMQVTFEGGNRPHKLKQFHFTAWPDHGVPDYATPMLAFHRRISSTHNTRRGPMLVHCSAGVGRTGTFICIDNVQEQIKKEQLVDIAGAINKMRHQRMKMVQTPEQYCFLHDAMLESVTCGDTQITAADLRMKIAKYQKVDPSTGIDTFQSQFDVLDQVSPKLSEVICKTAAQNPERNRNQKYLPSDRFRVILKGEQPDYIHAVFAHGYKHQKAFMIAENPMASTARNMLKILYDRKCGAVVMLSELEENGAESCSQYWPVTQGQMMKLGEYTVDLISEEVLEGFTIRAISILEQRTQKAHQVTQFHITCWRPDGYCSNLRCVVDVIDELAKVQRRTGNKPIFVHCSDTVTRSGMFCAMATVIDRCKTEGVVDVFQVVKALRVQRPGAVPTVNNYKTIFDATLTFLDSFDTYANFQNV